MSLAALARGTSAAPRLVGRQPPPSALAGRAPQAGAPAPPKPAPAQRSDGFDNLVKYIPTETVTIFVAVCSARPAVETIAGTFSYGMTYAACAALTPALLWLISAGRHRTAGGTGPVQFCWWPPTAATIAFLFWAMSVPGVTGMFADTEPQQAAWGVLAGIAALLVSLVLSLFEPLFGPREPVPPPQT